MYFSPNGNLTDAVVKLLNHMVNLPDMDSSKPNRATRNGGAVNTEESSGDELLYQCQSLISSQRNVTVAPDTVQFKASYISACHYTIPISRKAL